MNYRDSCVTSKSNVDKVDVKQSIMSTKKVLPRGGALRADLATDHIRELIGSGALGPGDRVNEVDIAEQLGVSRAPVREAIRRLASSGLVLSEPNMGARVVRIDFPHIRSLYEIREAVEAMGAGLAATRMDKAERSALVEMLDAHERSMQGTESSTYPSGPSDWDFHLAILKGSRNDVAWRICGQDFRELLTLLRARHGRQRGRGGRALLEHRWIAEAICAGNADLAQLLMAQHIRASRDNLFATIAAEETQVSEEGKQ